MSSFNASTLFLLLCYLSACTKEAKTLSSLSSRACGLSYSRMIPRFITITRSALRMVWTRCCATEQKKVITAVSSPANARSLGQFRNKAAIEKAVCASLYWLVN